MIHGSPSLSTKFRVELGVILLAWVFMVLAMARFRTALKAARILSKDNLALKTMIDAAADPKVTPCQGTSAANQGGSPTEPRTDSN